MLIVAGALFAVFGLNVVLGSMGVSQFLGDVGELLVVILSVIFFVTAIIQAENKEKQKEDMTTE